MELYNTLTETIEPLTTDDGTFRMYVCGVTPYDTTHLGHAFTYVCFDVLERYLEYLGHQTITVQNVTDIDDDIIRKSKEVGLPWDELGKRETEKYLRDMDALNVRRPDYFPAATEEIGKIIEMVKVLLEKELAYEVNGSVYYATRKDQDFGHHLVDMDYDTLLKIANERGNFPNDPNKRDPLDFVLWQAAQPGEPTWKSPWGPGRPGWHIECSAMSMKYLGSQIDIHCGGADLIFPHHSCEIVQSEGVTGVTPFVRYWFHIAMVEMNGAKMSKSLGNMIFVRDLLRKYPPDAIRLYLLSHHYRQEWSVDNIQTDLARVTAMLGRWRTALSAKVDSTTSLDATSYREKFDAAMNNDLNTPEAINAIDALSQAVLDAGEDGRTVGDGLRVLRDLTGVLGLMLPIEHR